jgi:hypothetical protein
MSNGIEPNNDQRNDNKTEEFIKITNKQADMLAGIHAQLTILAIIGILFLVSFWLRP